MENKGRQQVIEELIASRFTEKNVETELYRLLTDTAYRTGMLRGYTQVQAILGTAPAAQTAASLITRR